MTTKITTNTGKITQIVGPVVDIEFLEKLPAIYTALILDHTTGEKIYFEVEQQISETEVRCICLSSTDGLSRGLIVSDTGAPISVPVGEITLGRVFNVTGDVIDNGKELPKGHAVAPIHRAAPKLVDLETKPAMLETGIKVIDLISPFAKGGKLVPLEVPVWAKRLLFRN